MHKLTILTISTLLLALLIGSRGAASDTFTSSPPPATLVPGPWPTKEPRPTICWSCQRNRYLVPPSATPLPPHDDAIRRAVDRAVSIALGALRDAFSSR